MVRLLKKIDYSYYCIEKTVVVASLFISSVTVFLDVVNRRLESQESSITEILLLPKKIQIKKQLALAPTPAGEASTNAIEQINRQLEPSRLWIDRYVSPVILGAITFFFVLGAILASHKYKMSPTPAPKLSRGGIALALAAAVAYGLLLVSLPPQWRWGLLLIGGVISLLFWRYGSWCQPAFQAAAYTIVITLLAIMIVQLHSRWTYLALLTIGLITLLGSETFRQQPRRIAGLLVLYLALALITYRYLPGGFSWAKELSLMLIMWIIFMGGSMITYNGRHIMLDFFRIVIRKRSTKIYEGLSALVTTGFCLLLMYLAYLYVFGAPEPISIYSMHSTLPYTGIPSWIGIAAVPVGLASTSLRFIGIVVKGFQGKIGPPGHESFSLPTPTTSTSGDPRSDAKSEAQS